ncbi:MAG: nitrogen regulation protein NR(II) [Pseudomonadota bacterium]|nr:nitrogen regulation protein NR(II) [Pseudomonadota bacterium]HJO35681.1 nitrogen regulation protein NR(II) [Gammaproteobacteria bacterium]
MPRPEQLLDLLVTAVVFLDDELCVRYVNSAAESLLRKSANHCLHRPLDRLLPEWTELADRLAHALHTGAPYTERERVLRTDGEHPVVIDCIVSPVWIEGMAPGLVVELVQIDRHLRISREESLLAQQQAARAIVRGLAHEIKNPLGGLRGAAQLLDAQLSQPSLRDYTQVIMGEADRLQALVDALLGPNRMTPRRLTNIHEVTDRVRRLLAAEVGDEVAIRCDYDPSLPPVQADPDQLIQALLNVMRNAVQALAPQAARGEPAEIVLRTRSQRQVTLNQQRHRIAIRTDVIDNGPGIPPERIEQIFYPMVTTRADGSGLGLAIAHDLISRHGGTLECVSQPGQTRFTMLLPAADE